MTDQSQGTQTMLQHLQDGELHQSTLAVPSGHVSLEFDRLITTRRQLWVPIQAFRAFWRT